MPEFSLAITISAFIAGILTFFAPCTLPLIPAFLGIISGAEAGGLKDPEKIKVLRKRIFKNAIFYVLGFSLIFILFGISFTFVVEALGLKIWIERIGGIFVFIFGMILLGWLNIPFLSSDQKIRVPQLFRHVSLFNSFLLGAIFAVGWSPCVGPLLGSVLLIASTSGTVLQGTFLLVIFSIGLGIPFLLTALLIGKAFSAFSRWASIFGIINRVAGILLLCIGFLLILDKFSLVHREFMLYFYRFQFFEVFINKFL